MSNAQAILDRKYAAAWRISMWANALSILAPVGYVLYQLWGTFAYVTISTGQRQAHVQAYIPHTPIDIFNSLLTLANVLLTGAIYFVILRGIALGLDMIIQTDMNHHANRRGDDAK